MEPPSVRGPASADPGPSAHRSAVGVRAPGSRPTPSHTAAISVETALEVLENRLAGQTSELVRLRKSAEAAEALLDLHAACTRQRTVAGTARQIAAVASAMTRADAVVVAIFQAVSQRPLLAVSLGDGVMDEDAVGDLVCQLADQPDLAWLHTESRLRVISRHNASPSTAVLLAQMQAARVLITPLFGQGEFVGCIVAKLPHVSPDPDEVTIIEGASALQAHAGDLIHLAIVLDELRRRALHDAITGLANLDVFEQRLVRAIARRRASQPGHAEVAAILVQVVGVGRVTEMHGSTGVQELLREIANRLAAMAADHDLGHLGASHFALIAHGDPGAGIDLAREAIVSLQEPYRLSFGEVRLACFAGVATVTEGIDAIGLIRRAEAAARTARVAGLQIHIDS